MYTGRKSYTKVVGQMTATMVLVLILVLLVVAAIFVSRFLSLRALRVVVSGFRKQGAIDANSAKTLVELDLVRARLLDGMFRGRDYRPQALRLLARAEIVKPAEGGRFYLSESALENSRIKKVAGIK
jgi:hypothetical protein